MSRGSSSKVTGIPSLGAVGQGDSAYKLGRPPRPRGTSGDQGSPSTSADSGFSSKYATAKILDVPDDIEPPPMFPWQDPNYMKRQRSKPQPTSTSKGVVLRLTKQQLRTTIREEFKSDNIDISEDRLDEFIGALMRPIAGMARSAVGGVADDIIAAFAPRLLKPLHAILPKSIAAKVGPVMLAKIATVGKEIFGDLPDSILEGRAAIANFDSYMAANPRGAGDAWTDDFYHAVEGPLRDSKFKILENLIDIPERLADPTGTGLSGVFKGAIKTAAKGAGATMLVDKFDSLRRMLSVIGKMIPGEDSIEQAFDVVEELDKRIESIGSFKSPTGEVGGAPAPSWQQARVQNTGYYQESTTAFIELKNLLREFMEADELSSCDDDDEDCDEDVDEISSGGVAGYAAPLNYDPVASQRMKKMYSRHYKTVGPELKPKP